MRFSLVSSSVTAGLVVSLVAGTAMALPSAAAPVVGVDSQCFSAPPAHRSDGQSGRRPHQPRRGSQRDEINQYCATLRIRDQLASPAFGTATSRVGAQLYAAQAQEQAADGPGHVHGGVTTLIPGLAGRRPVPLGRRLAAAHRRHGDPRDLHVARRRAAARPPLAAAEGGAEAARRLPRHRHHRRLDPGLRAALLLGRAGARAVRLPGPDVRRAGPGRLRPAAGDCTPERLPGRALPAELQLLPRRRGLAELVRFATQPRLRRRSTRTSSASPATRSAPPR